MLIILAILEMFVVNILYIHSIVYVLLDPCLTTQQITEWQRSLSNVDTFDMCDTFLREGWYVVSSNAGSMMPTECPVGGFRCGTTYPIYLSRGIIKYYPI
jgi:hypothetical protein